ncbi:hypothetical protein IEQ34_012060 [Dendrobium chrysotoxum]|uniref:Uncharacterized protein n=1 Tax=Dendrobium chrysotoxum TaxID=161865 RepID=A0AAV7GTB8_DENCH|nr:hypothetical protein IEQ34_012060 [Dendrobium chrysotoxum]
MLRPMHDDRFRWVAGAERGEIGEVADFAFDRGEIEWDSKSGGEIGEAAAGGVEDFGCGADAGDANGLNGTSAGGEHVKQSRPLKAMHDIEVEDVDTVVGS